MKNAESKRQAPEFARQRVVIYMCAGAGLMLAYAALRGSGWHGSASLHTLMEAVATLVALIVGAMAFVRFYSEKNNTVLFIGAGFLGTAFLDGYHAVVTSAAFKPYMPSELPALIPWSWVASRQFLSIFLFLSWVAWLRERRLREAGQVGETAVYLFAATFALASFLFFALMPLPRAYYPEIFFHRPEEFVPAVFFLAALAGYMRKGMWRHDKFEHWLILSLIAGFASQAVFMSSSGSLFDIEFDTAHLLKTISYVCVLTGLMASMYETFQREAKRSVALVAAKERAETALSELAAHKLALDEHAIVAVTDIGGSIAYVNDKFCEVSGYRRDELIGASHRILKSGHHPNSFYEEMWSTILNGQPWHGEIKNRAKDGSYYWVDTTIYPKRDEQGRIREYISIRTDITKHRESEELLAQQARSMDLMNAIAVTANQSTDANTSFRACLEHVCRSTGWDFAHVYVPVRGGTGELHSSGCWYASDDEKFRQFRELALKTVCREGLVGSVYRNAMPEWRRDVARDEKFSRANAARQAGLTGRVAFPVSIRDEVVAVFEFFSTHPLEASQSFTDIMSHIGAQMGWVVERMRANDQLVEHRDHLQDLIEAATEELKEKAAALQLSLSREKELNELQRKFVSMASHEFRTPLAIIDSSVQRLIRQADKAGPEEITKRSQRIRSAVRRMSNLMESTLAAARADAGVIKLDFNACDLRALIREACERQQDLSHSHQIDCDLAGLPASVRANGPSLDQVFTNLLSNAVKFSPDNPKITVTGWQEGEEVVVVVEDRGFGIDADDLPKMFERYFRAKTSTGIAGTGIGLDIVRMFVEHHDGVISVESEKGKGSRFMVRLPIAGPAGLEQPDSRVA